MDEIEYRRNSATQMEIISHFPSCGTQFYQALKGRVDISVYADKLIGNAERFEAWDKGVLIGLLAIYYNRNGPFDFISNLSVSENYQGQGVARHLLEQGVKLAGESREIRLEVSKDNASAIEFYRRAGFRMIGENGAYNTMTNKTEQLA